MLGSRLRLVVGLNACFTQYVLHEVVDRTPLLVVTLSYLHYLPHTLVGTRGQKITRPPSSEGIRIRLTYAFYGNAITKTRLTPDNTEAIHNDKRASDKLFYRLNYKLIGNQRVTNSMLIQTLFVGSGGGEGQFALGPTQL